MSGGMAVVMGAAVACPVLPARGASSRGVNGVAGWFNKSDIFIFINPYVVQSIT